MLAYFKKNSRTVPVAAQVEDEEEQVDVVVEEAEAAAEPVPSSGTKGSVDALSEVASTAMLADLLEKQIDKIGKEHVVQIVTDNGANFRAAGRLLMEKIPHLFWTPCAAHCLDLLLEDIGKIPKFNSCIKTAMKVTRFMYKHGRVLDLMRNKIGGDLETSTQEGRRVENIILSVQFWGKVESCLKASQPLLVALRIANGDETPAAMAAMDVAKAAIKESLKHKPEFLKQVLHYYDNRWENQMEQKLYKAALFLNPSKFFAIKGKNMRQASRLRLMFNQVMWKMVSEEEEHNKISMQADDYERAEGESFSMQGAIRDRDRKNPILWWGAYGGATFELQCLEKRIVRLCCSASGCERNWSDFSAVHTKKRNQLEHQRLNKLVYVSYNRKMENKFKRIIELGSKGKRSNPLILDEFQWENEWLTEIDCEPVQQGGVQQGGGNLTWAQVDEAIGATQELEGRNMPRAAHAAPVSQTYQRTRKRPRTTISDIDEDGDERQDQNAESNSATLMEEDEVAAAEDGDEGFRVNDDLLD
ncbi:hAT dimerisation domain-containing protein [Striga hermonthica]|uniref:HAT dimerisation domain-containing protein n=1 Tax=Striga hermonthica TaxID=68872 RepID=A0A9N7NXG6_STRHE|nr:hAT dimerisation domain-containing protein [Striga hermonthica]